MRRTGISRVSLVLALLAPALATGPWTSQSFAQGSVRIQTAGGPAGLASPTEPPITSAQIDRYANLLSLTQDQRTALKDMHQTFLNEHATAAALMQQKLDDARAEADESGQFENFMKTMQSSRETYTQAVDQARTRMFDDLRLLLTPEQEQQWPALERTRRRMENIKRGVLSSESVDLVQMVDDLKFPDDVRAPLGPVLDAYEPAMDTALQERIASQDALKEKLNQGQNGPGAFLQRNTEDYKGVHDASLKVRDVNITFARQLSDSLPTEYKDKFDTEFQRRSFPQIYASTYTQRVFDSAQEFPDLTPEQKDQIAALEDRLTRELDAANAKWAQEVKADEENPNTEVLIAEQFGMPMEIRLGEEPETLSAAKTARSDLATQYLDQVRSLLSPEQQARLPKREPAQRSPGAVGAKMMFIEAGAQQQQQEQQQPHQHGTPQ